eukprot:TRINITY_DN316_c0_g1_i1.p1 TRINITY_DN316_c0_g1~~TRINITY_DN316_c0_g1_i1.p1  ORF type:complete len:332 (-),score=107.70 TRINITY_DN316_c0_g1_i1:79-1074(-)
MARKQAIWVAAVWAGAGFLVAGTPARKSKEISSYDDYDDYSDSDGPVAVTCPGFPGYCSESYVGDTCTVVCARGRNNVPQCQEDGTWTDIPRCIEHDPGVEQQVTGICPGIPGYCSLDWPGALCEFACPIGPAIRSSCTPDGTWEPYPTCEGDPRETQDGCNPCPGPDGAPRNRTVEAGGRSEGRGNNNIPRNGGKKQEGGGNRSGGSQNRNGGGVKQGSGENRNGGKSAGAQQRFGGGNRNDGGQNRPQGAGQNRSQNGGQNRIPTQGQTQTQNRSQSRSQNQPKQSGGQSSGQCPGDELQACIDVCPGFSARVFGACVRGCAKRCPAKK